MDIYVTGKLRKFWAGVTSLRYRRKPNKTQTVERRENLPDSW